MIGTLDTTVANDSTDRSVTIVGAGIAGLVLAEALDLAGWRVTLLEAAPQAGGLIRTDTTPYGPAEWAAHSLLATQPVLDLCARLDVELEPVRKASRARYIWRGGRLRKFPLSLGELLRMLGRVYLSLSDSKRDPARITLEDWARRHLGEPALKFLLTPFVRGIYGARPSELEVGLAFPALVVPHGHSLASWLFRRWHLKLRGKLPRAARGRPRMVAPKRGMSALTHALEARMRGRLENRFRLGAPIDRLPDVGEARNLVLCVPAPEAARLLAASDPALSRALARVEYSPLVCATVFAEKLAFATPPLGVGVLLPEGTGRRCLGVLFNSSAFDERVSDESKHVSLTVMLGGSARPELADPRRASDAEISAWIREDLEKLFDLAPGSRLECVIHRQPRAVPRYDAQLGAAWEAARAGWCSRPGRLLFGNYTGQVSVRGMIELAAKLCADQA